MSAATLTRTPASKPSSPFLRSHSAPDIVSLAPNPSASSETSTLARKSLPGLPIFDFAPSLDDVAFGAAKSPTVTVSTLSAHPSAATDDSAVQRLNRPRSRSHINRPHSWVPSHTNDADFRHGAPGYSPADYSRTQAQVQPASPALLPPQAPRNRSRTASGTYIDLARRPWLPRARSRSPSVDGDRVDLAAGASPDKSASGKRLWRRQKPTANPIAGVSTESLSSTSRALSRATLYFTKIRQSPQSVFGRSVLEPPPAVPPDIPAKSAVSRLAFSSSSMLSPGLDPDAIHRHSKGSAYTSSSSEDTTADEAASTAIGASEGESGTTADSTVRDPLWAAFRDLDGAYHAFVAKSTTPQRISVVKTALMPFLNRFACDPSNKDTNVLWPEDVERRATILGKWWAALLHQLDGESGRVVWNATIAEMLPRSCTPQPLAGGDRPALLSAITLLMMRPEWRLITTYFRPLAERSPAEKVRARSDSGARSLDGSFITRSTEANVRAIFVSTLLAQLALVVDKMSLRHPPMSLVNFSGKTCAYAFFFVPGVAQILVRLWSLGERLGAITRVVDELGLPRTSNGESEDIVALFPPSLGSLGWMSVKAVAAKLRRSPKIPPPAAQIPWGGPWVSRWRGGDTNLFFIFCKYFYIISEEFVPTGLPLVEKARGPAFVLVHAQLLSILDDTINRQATFEALMRPPLSDALHGADAALTPMAPLLPYNNLLRGMEENCLIVLLRDFLSADHSLLGARQAFAEAFMCLLKGATKHTGRYDHNAQHLLCDFLQEALAAYAGGSGLSMAHTGDRCLSPAPPPDSLLGFVDWPFWLQVCKMMLSNNNTMSEIRTLSFLFSTWDIIAADPARKEAVCLDWLLTEDVFAKFFSNWCPMVRAYYMRLLCWRVCRDAGSANEMDARIFMVASERLRETWSHYLWLKQKAESTGSAYPSTAPSLPQPGKRFMIVRTEVFGTPQRGLLASHDPKPSPQQQHDLAGGANGRASADIALDLGDGRKVDESKAPSTSRRWSRLGKVLGLNSGQPHGAPTSTGRRRSYDDEFDRMRRDLAATRSKNVLGIRQTGSEDPPPPPPKIMSQSGASITSSDSDSTGSSPMFDAAQFVFRFTLHNMPWHGGFLDGPFRDRILTRPRLPAPAQARVSLRIGSAGRRSESPPPPAPGPPPATRLVSGWAQGGLVSGARNAQPLGGSSGGGDFLNSPQSPSPSLRGRMPGPAASVDFVPIGKLPFEHGIVDDVVGEKEAEPRKEAATSRGDEQNPDLPVRPVGVHAITSRYSGRALAEWTMVVSECNSFVDRRRDEGVLGLRDVEVPILGVEGLRRSA